MLPGLVLHIFDGQNNSSKMSQYAQESQSGLRTIEDAHILSWRCLTVNIIYPRYHGTPSCKALNESRYAQVGEETRSWLRPISTSFQGPVVELGAVMASANIHVGL